MDFKFSIENDGKGSVVMLKSLSVSNRVGDIPDNAIDEMTQLSRKIDDVSFFSWAKPTSKTPEHINKAAMEAIEKGLVGGYSESLGLTDLRRAIVEKLQYDNNIRAEESEVMVTVGAIEASMSALMALVDPGDEVILPSPTYATHIQQVRIASARPVFVPFIEENGFTLDLDGIRKAITPRTKAIIYCTPVNPTGTVISEKELKELAEIAIDYNLMVISDEAYEYFTYDSYRHFSIGSIPEMKDRVVSCFTFTKTYVMTGWRIGYLHATGRLISQINKAHIPLAICAPVVSQYAALAALKGPKECIDEFRDHYEASRDLMCKRLDKLKGIFEYQKPRGAYLMFPRILLREGENSVEFCKKLLKEAKISATPGSAFGPTGESHLRLSFCLDEDYINKAFDRLEKYFLI